MQSVLRLYPMNHHLMNVELPRLWNVENQFSHALPPAKLALRPALNVSKETLLRAALASRRSSLPSHALDQLLARPQPQAHRLLLEDRRTTALLRVSLTSKMYRFRGLVEASAHHHALVALAQLMFHQELLPLQHASSRTHQATSIALSSALHQAMANAAQVHVKKSRPALAFAHMVLLSPSSENSLWLCDPPLHHGIEVKQLQSTTNAHTHITTAAISDGILNKSLVC